MSDPKPGYLHSREECGTHDYDVIGECCGCGTDAIACLEEERKEAVVAARADERTQIVAWLRSRVGPAFLQGAMSEKRGHKQAFDVLANAMQILSEQIEAGAHRVPR